MTEGCVSGFTVCLEVSGKEELKEKCKTNVSEYKQIGSRSQINVRGLNGDRDRSLSINCLGYFHLSFLYFSEY